MSDTAMVPRKSEGGPPARRPLIDEQLADELLGKAAAEGVELLGPDGLLSQVTKAVLERALAEEMTGRLGYEKHDPPVTADHEQVGVLGLLGECDCGPVLDQPGDDRDVGLRSQCLRTALFRISAASRAWSASV